MRAAIFNLFRDKDDALRWNSLRRHAARFDRHCCNDMSRRTQSPRGRAHSRIISISCRMFHHRKRRRLPSHRHSAAASALLCTLPAGLNSLSLAHCSPVDFFANGTAATLTPAAVPHHCLALSKAAILHPEMHPCLQLPAYWRIRPIACSLVKETRCR